MSSHSANDDKCVFFRARHCEMQQCNLKAIAGDSSDIKDGERIPVAVKDMGSCEVYPQTIAHNPNGRLDLKKNLSLAFAEICTQLFNWLTLRALLYDLF